MIETASMLAVKATAGPIIATAQKTAQAAIKKANDTERTDLERTLANLTAADTAIQGLGHEWEDLLSTAASCPLRDTEAVQQLVNRIESYLTRNLLRSELRLALDGLEEERDVIEGHSKTIRQYPWKRKNRARALQRYIQTFSNLVEFMNSLGSWVEPMDPSGVGWNHLKDIQEVLRNRMLDLEQARRQVNELVQKARNDPSLITGTSDAQRSKPPTPSYCGPSGERQLGSPPPVPWMYDPG
jgi:hypothetical protein